jgi:ArsR family transcriptional regulator
MNSQLKQEIAALHANLCNALSNPTRILIVCLLSEGSRTVTDLAGELELAQPAVSRHLKVLQEKGLIYPQRDGKFTHYHLSDYRVIEALQIMRDVVTDMLREQVALAHRMQESDLLREN